MILFDVTVDASIATQVLGHLSTQPEMVAFLRGRVIEGRAVMDTAWMLRGADLDLTEWHVSLTDASRQQLMQWAAGAEVLIESHSHGDLGGPACLSKTDLDGLSEWVPHVQWRVPGVTYVSLVSGANTFDGLAWLPRREPVGVGDVDLGASGIWRATGRSLLRWTQLHD